MATLKFYLDTRSKLSDGTFPLKIALNHKSKTAFIPLNIKLKENQFDKVAQKIINHPSKQIFNNAIISRKLELEEKIFEINKVQRVSLLSVQELKNLLTKEDTKDQPKKILFVDVFKKYVSLLDKFKTISNYNTTLNKLRDYYPNIDKLEIENFSTDFFRGFIQYCKEKNNSANTIWSNSNRIKTIVNFAYKEDLISKIPYKNIVTKPTPTAKRNLTLEQIKILFSLEPKSKIEKYVYDLAKLTFLLIGINYVDLVSKEIEINNDRVEYIRHKTGKFYSIKLLPEAKKIIEKYQRDGYIFPPYNDNYKTYINGENYANRVLADMFSNVRKKISLYYLRHSWASLASSIDIPKETIAHALGHSNNSVTDVYINFDLKKVDKANEKLFELVFG